MHEAGTDGSEPSIPAKLSVLSAAALRDLVEATKKQICSVEQAILQDFDAEEKELAAPLNPAVEKKENEGGQLEPTPADGAAAVSASDVSPAAGTFKEDTKADSPKPANGQPESSAPDSSQVASSEEKKVTSMEVEVEAAPATSATIQEPAKPASVEETSEAVPKSSEEPSAEKPASPSQTATTVPSLNVKEASKPAKDTGDSDIWRPPPLSVPIRADVRKFDFENLAKHQKRATGKMFDVIMTDPPWQLATSNPTRGVAIGYEQLSDSLIEDIPFPSLQENGLLFIWVINAKYKFALELMEKWGYTLVDEIAWVKQTVNRRLAKSHGFYLQHAKETCLVGRKGSDPPGMVGNIASDIIASVRRGQSQKPVEIYEIIEQLVPGGNYLEIFARRNNLRNGWVSIGNEL